MIFKEYPKFSIGNDKLLHLVVSTIDAKQLQELSCKVLQGTNLLSVLNMIRLNISTCNYTMHDHLINIYITLDSCYD